MDGPFTKVRRSQGRGAPLRRSHRPITAAGAGKRRRRRQPGHVSKTANSLALPSRGVAAPEWMRPVRWEQDDPPVCLTIATAVSLVLRMLCGVAAVWIMAKKILPGRPRVNRLRARSNSDPVNSGRHIDFEPPRLPEGLSLAQPGLRASYRMPKDGAAWR